MRIFFAALITVKLQMAALGIVETNKMLVNCVRDMDAWMLSNKLKLTKDKSDVRVLSSSYANDLLLIYVMRLYPVPPVHAILELSLISPFIFPSSS